MGLAVANNKPPVVGLLVKKGADPNGVVRDTTHLVRSIELGRLAIARRLLEVGADPNLPTPDGPLRPSTPWGAARRLGGKKRDAAFQLLEEFGGAAPTPSAKPAELKGRT